MHASMVMPTYICARLLVLWVSVCWLKCAAIVQSALLPLPSCPVSFPTLTVVPKLANPSGAPPPGSQKQATRQADSLSHNFAFLIF